MDGGEVNCVNVVNILKLIYSSNFSDNRFGKVIL